MGGSVDTSAEGGRGKGRVSQDFELNLAPIIDCLVVLIAFLMVSLSYISINMMDAGVSLPGSGLARGEAGKTLELKVINKEGLEVEWKTEGTKEVRKVQVTDLTKELAKLKEKGILPELATVSAADDVPYEKIVKVMDTVKTDIKNIQLSGF